MALKLNIERIERERVRRGFQKQELARRLKISSGMMTQIYKTQPLKYAEKIGKIFDIEPKDLII